MSGVICELCEGDIHTVDEDLEKFFNWIDGKISDEEYGSKTWEDMTESEKDFWRALQHEFDKDIFSSDF